MMCVGLSISQPVSRAASKNTYIWESTVCALADLRLVCVYEYSWVTKCSSSTITRNRFGADPSDGLFVDQVDGCIGSWLCFLLEYFYKLYQVKLPVSP